MGAFFAVSYASICGLVVFESVILGTVLRETVTLKRLRYDVKCRQKQTRLPSGTLVPEFSTHVVGSSLTVTRSNLEGHPTILIFISPAEMSSEHSQDLRHAIHAMWHKVDGNVYLFCGDSEQRCLQFANQKIRNGLENHPIPILLDEGRRIARQFMVTTTPQAIELDRNIRVQRYGRPMPQPDEKKSIERPMA